MELPHEIIVWLSCTDRKLSDLIAGLQARSELRLGWCSTVGLHVIMVGKGKKTNFLLIAVQ